MFQRGVETFLAVARLKTLKAAAVSLHLAQSTVSKRLRLLEEECGIVLFDRGRGGKEVTLTPDGERFIGTAERLLDLLYEAKRPSAERGRLSLNIGVVTSMNAVIFPSLYHRLLEQEPNLHLTIETLHSGEMYDHVDTRRNDIAFSLLERVHPGVAAVPCFSEPMLGIRLVGGGPESARPVPLASLDPEREIHFPWTPKYQIWHSEVSSPGAIRITVDDPHLVVQLMRSRDQWAIVPLSVARFFRESGRYRIFQLSPSPPDRVCYALTHKHPRARTAESLALLWKHLRPILREQFGETMDGRPARDRTKPS